MSGMKRAAVTGYCSDPNDQSNVYIDQSEMVRNLTKRVIRAEKWQCPLEKGWQWLAAVGVGHQGVVVTLEDHKTRYIVHKLPAQTAGNGDTVVGYASSMGSNWSRFGQKVVSSSVLKDYIHQSGTKYDIWTDNCIHAVDRMWALK